MTTDIEENAPNMPLNSYVAGTTAPRRYRPRWIGLLVVGAIAVVGAGIAISGGSSETGADPVTASQSEEPPPGMIIPTEEELAAGRAKFEAQFHSGWVPYQNVDLASGQLVSGWLRVTLDESGAPDAEAARAETPPSGDGAAVYDAPGGLQIGYQYQALGFVPIDRADEFDSSAARVAKYGCDPVLGAQAQACIEILEERKASTGSTRLD